MKTKYSLLNRSLQLTTNQKHPQPVTDWKNLNRGLDNTSLKTYRVFSGASLITKPEKMSTNKISTALIFIAMLAISIRMLFVALW